MGPLPRDTFTQLGAVPSFEGIGRSRVAVRPLSRDDFPLLQRWLGMPHVQRWWRGEPAVLADVEHKYGPRADGTDPTRVFVVERADHPIGIIQCYRHEDYPD